MFVLTPELKTYAKENCNESLELQGKLLSSLKSWLKKTPHLKPRTNDELLLSFLRTCRYNFMDTKTRIDNFYSMKCIFPEVLSNRVISESLMELYRQGIHIIPIKPLSATGPRIIISQYNKYDSAKTDANEVLKLFFILLEILANEDPYASIAGVTYVIDARDVTMEQMLQYDSYLLNKMWTLVDHGLPIKFREIHLINMRKERQSLFQFVTSFLPSKMPMKFIVHKRAEDLYDHLPRDSMTVEYGGHNGYQQEALKHWENVMIKYKNYFADDDKYCVNEKLRSSPTATSITGLRGSFRKLDVD